MRAGYGGCDCLHDVSCAFSRGRLIGLVGPNGSGKSTLIKVAACQLRPSGGALYLDGEPVVKPDPKVIAKRVAYMPQTRIAPSITVRQLVAHGRYPHLGFGRALSKADREMVDRAMEMARVAEFLYRPVDALSGGERQRAYLAMLLAQDAPLILLDEPTAYLDARYQFELMDLLAEMKAVGKAVVVAMHELALALSSCDELMLLSKGELVAAVPPRALHESGELERAFGVGIHLTPGGHALTKSAAKEAMRKEHNP